MGKIGLVILGVILLFALVIGGCGLGSIQQPDRKAKQG